MSSKAREGFDWLTRSMPMLDVLSVEWQEDGPWVLVTLGQPSERNPEVFARYPYAIWKHTGAVHGMNMGAVIDPPLFKP